MGLMIQESSQSLHRLLVEWETCQNPDYLGKSKNPNLWPGNVKIQHGLLGEPGQSPDYLRNCTSKKMGLYDPGMSIQYRLGEHPICHTSPFENPVSKKQAPPFWNGSQFGFFGQEKAKLLAQGPGRKKSRYRKKKLVKSGVDTVSFLLCILLVPNALPKRERSLWLPPQNVLRQGWLGHYFKSFPDNWNQVFLR